MAQCCKILLIVGSGGASCRSDVTVGQVVLGMEPIVGACTAPRHKVKGCGSGG